MLKNKKFIIIAVLAAVVLAGSIGGVALAQTDSDNATSGNSLTARVAAILGIQQQTLEDAFTQARSEQRESAVDSYLDNLVAEGTITREQADEYKAWWESKPDMTQYRQQLRNWQQSRPGMPSEMEEWREARPDGFEFGFGGRGGGSRGMRGQCDGMGGPCFTPAD
ncbi:MAG: hypothetical protein PHN78_02625 [Dehalococcoidales bacterium]|nr:hypothetical protein [Dehalococcoidales bacterium]